MVMYFKWLPRTQTIRSVALIFPLWMGLALHGGAEAECQVPPAEVDVVIVIDGSGSMSSSEFGIQRDGLMAAVNAPSFLPRDGSIALGVVQFTSGARVEVPLTAVDTEAGAQSIVTALGGLRQVGGGTNHAAGVRSAWNLLVSGGRSTAAQVICLATDDGSPSSALGTSLEDARDTPPSLDRFGVLAVDPDAGGLQPYVFGGGTVATTTSVAEFANSLRTMCFTPRLLEFDRPMANFEVTGGYRFGDDWEPTTTTSDCDSAAPRPFRHVGVDVNSHSVGEDVFAIADGQVMLCRRTANDGEVIVIEHRLNGVPVATSTSWHVTATQGICPSGKQAGAEVYRGQLIATVYALKDKGKDASHLHLGIRFGPYDPNVSLRGALPPPGTQGCVAKSDRMALPPFPEQFVDPELLIQ